MTPKMERFYLGPPRAAAKNRVCTLEVGCRVCLDRECAEFVTAG